MKNKTPKKKQRKKERKKEKQFLTKKTGRRNV